MPLTIVRTPLREGIAGYNETGTIIYIDPRVPKFMMMPLQEHIELEIYLIFKEGLDPVEADALATRREKEACEIVEVSWTKYDAEYDKLMSTLDPATVDPEDIDEAYKINRYEKGYTQKEPEIKPKIQPKEDKQGAEVVPVKEEPMEKESKSKTYNDKVNIEVSKTCSLFKGDDLATAKRLVYGVALVPDVVDLQNQYVTADVIEEIAHDFMLDYRKEQSFIGLKHGDDEAAARVVQSFIAPIDYQLGAQLITKGSWVLVVKIFSDELWQAVLEGKLTGFSIRGMGEVVQED
jgi:hypothetical protein